MNELGVLDKFPDFSHCVGEPLHLEGKSFRGCLQIESFGGVDFIFTVFTEIFVLSLEFIGGEEFL